MTALATLAPRAADAMSLFEAVVLGVVQGLTEFFPVSSSGHLVLGEALLGVDPPGVSFEVVAHLGTLASVLFLYRRRVAELANGLLHRDPGAFRYVGLLALATLPAAVAGLTLSGPIARLFHRPVLAAAALLATGAVVYATRRLVARGVRPEPRWAGALAVGVAQAVALVPGISRSGMTVAAALGVGVERERAAEFSFLMSVPAILGASLLELPGHAGAGPGEGLPLAVMAAAAAAAFVAGVLAIAVFVRWLRAGRFHRFAYYCWAVGASYILYALITG